MTVRCDCGGGIKDGRWNRQPAWRCVFATLLGQRCIEELVRKAVRATGMVTWGLAELLRSWCPQ